MLSTNDVGELFEAMRTAYGPQWKHGSSAMEVWRRAMTKHTPKELMRAASDVLRVHVDHPPTLPQFVSVLENRQPRKTTYLAPPSIPDAAAAGNRALFRVIGRERGIESPQLKLCVQLKNALVEDHGDRPVDRAFVESLEHELAECAKRQDREVRGHESEAARQTFKRRRGMQAWA